MRVSDIMTKFPKYCNSTTNLAAVAELMWSAGCGALPVVNGEGKVVGFITDRDICVALGTRNKRASELVAAQVMSNPVVACRPCDEIHPALKLMRERKIRRLPVVNDRGMLEGVLGMSDMVFNGRHDDGRASRPDLSYEDVIGALICIYGHRLPSEICEASRREMVVPPRLGLLRVKTRSFRRQREVRNQRQMI